MKITFRFYIYLLLIFHFNLIRNTENSQVHLSYLFWLYNYIKFLNIKIWFTLSEERAEKLYRLQKERMVETFRETFHEYVTGAVKFIPETEFCCISEQ